MRLLAKRLGPAARVGSVDRFRGQEAPAVIVSICACTLEEAPRGARLRLNRHRLNVAISRIKALAIVVASPRLTQAARCHTQACPKPAVRSARRAGTNCAIGVFVAPGRIRPAGHPLHTGPA